MTYPRLGELQRDFARAQSELLGYVREECKRHYGGPHEPVQHRDAKPPWCRACGRDQYGNLMRKQENTPPKHKRGG